MFSYGTSTFFNQPILNASGNKRKLNAVLTRELYASVNFEKIYIQKKTFYPSKELTTSFFLISSSFTVFHFVPSEYLQGFW